MGSGRTPSNIKIPPSPFADGGGVHCPEHGRLSATVLEPDRAGAPGQLEVRDEQVVLVVAGEDVAMAVDVRLRECVRAGFAYSGALEVADGPPVIRFSLE